MFLSNLPYFSQDQTSLSITHFEMDLSKVIPDAKATIFTEDKVY